MDTIISDQEPIEMNFVEERMPIRAMPTRVRKRRCCGCHKGVSRSAAYCSHCGQAQGFSAAAMLQSRKLVGLLALAGSAALAAFVVLAAVVR